MLRSTELEEIVRKARDCCARIQQMVAEERNLALHDHPRTSSAGERLQAEADSLLRLVNEAASRTQGDAENPFRAELKAIVTETVEVVETSLTGLREAQKVVMADLRGLNRSREAIRAYNASR